MTRPSAMNLLLRTRVAGPGTTMRISCSTVLWRSVAMGDRHVKERLFEQFAAVGKALANPKRLELLDLLAQGERSVEALAAAAGLGLTTTSANLQTLRSAGLVASRREKTK